MRGLVRVADAHDPVRDAVLGARAGRRVVRAGAHRRAEDRRHG